MNIEDTNQAFSRAAFEQVMEQEFILIRHDGDDLALTLAKLRGSPHSNEDFDCFSLYFRAPDGEPPLADNTYLLENSELGKMYIHLSASPVMTDGPGSYEYEAVFNIRNT